MADVSPAGTPMLTVSATDMKLSGPEGGLVTSLTNAQSKTETHNNNYTSQYGTLFTSATAKTENKKRNKKHNKPNNNNNGKEKSDLWRQASKTNSSGAI